MGISNDKWPLLRVKSPVVARGPFFVVVSVGIGLGIFEFRDLQRAGGHVCGLCPVSFVL